MAALSRLDLGPNLRARLGPEFFNSLLAEDDRCMNRRVFARLEHGAPDGLAVDEDGSVWVAAHGGSRVTRYTADGAFDRHIDVPAVFVTSLCLGGPDRRDL